MLVPDSAERLLKQALFEAWGSTGALALELFSQNRRAAFLVARAAGRMAGSALPEVLARLAGRSLESHPIVAEGEPFLAGERILRFVGATRDIEAIARTAALFLSKTCGFATFTSEIVKKLAPFPGHLMFRGPCTPGFAFFEQLACRAVGLTCQPPELSHGITISESCCPPPDELSTWIQEVRNTSIFAPLTLECETPTGFQRLTPHFDQVVFIDWPLPEVREMLLKKNKTKPISIGIYLTKIETPHPPFDSRAIDYLILDGILRDAPSLPIQLVWEG